MFPRQLPKNEPRGRKDFLQWPCFHLIGDAGPDETKRKCHTPPHTRGGGGKGREYRGAVRKRGKMTGEGVKRENGRGKGG